MKLTVITLILVCAGLLSSAQEQTAYSLYFKKEVEKQLSSVESKSGNLFRKLGHHGPAVENQWLGLRIYFDKKAAIDLYSKAKPGLELREKMWYPDKEDQRKGWGADYYKVGKTVGLGGIRLWENDQLILLNPVDNRKARVYHTENGACMELISEGISYKNQKIDVLTRVTVYDDRREAKVEGFALNGEEVNFVTGINYFKGMKVDWSDNYYATWGLHPEDVAAEKVEVGAAIVFEEEQFQETLDMGDEILLISKPRNYVCVWVTSANAREKNINSYSGFEKMVKAVKEEIIKGNK